jgi:hypothetical protein
MERRRPSKSSTKSTSDALVPGRRLAFFGPPPLIDGEDPAAYEALLARVFADVKPADVIEEIWVHDYVDLTWDVIRLRKLKASFLNVGATKVLPTELGPLHNDAGQDEDDLSLLWAKREPAAIKQVTNILASNGKTIETVLAKALTANLDAVERIESLIALAEGRRDAVLREIDRHRATLAHALRRRVEQIEDADFKVIDGP